MRCSPCHPLNSFYDGLHYGVDPLFLSFDMHTRNRRTRRFQTVFSTILKVPSLNRRHGPTTFSVVIVDEVFRTGFAHVSSLSARKDAGKFLVRETDKALRSNQLRRLARFLSVLIRRKFPRSGLKVLFGAIANRRRMAAAPPVKAAAAATPTVSNSHPTFHSD
jgi:hypothetical protein